VIKNGRVGQRETEVSISGLARMHASVAQLVNQVDGISHILDRKLLWRGIFPSPSQFRQRSIE
jgi:hypothetical protein